MDQADGQVKPKLTLARLIRLSLFLFILLLIPFLTFIFAQSSRRQINAETLCKSPPIPDPKDCLVGQWKLVNAADGCIHFQCAP